MVSLSTSNFCNIKGISFFFPPLISFAVLFMGYALMWTIRGSVLAHQLYVVDAFLFELLQSSFGLFLQWECKTLESLCTLVQAKLHGDLPDIKVKGKTGKGQYGENKMPANQMAANPRSCRRSPDSSTIVLRMLEKVKKKKKVSPETPRIHSWINKNNKKDIPAQLYPAESREGNIHHILRSQHSSNRAG